MPIVFGRCVGRERRGEGVRDGASPSAARRRFPFMICRRQSSLVGAGEAVVPAVAVVSAGRHPASPVRKPSPPSASRRCGRCRRLARTDRPLTASTSSPREEVVIVVPSSPSAITRAVADPGRRAPPSSAGGGGGGGEAAASSSAGRAKSPRRFSKSKKVHRQESGSATAGGGGPGGAAGGGKGVPTASQPPTAPSSAAPPARQRHHHHQQQQQQQQEDASSVAEGGGSAAHASSSTSTSFATWVIKRVQNLRFFQPKRDELDPEELDMLQPARCRPERLEAIRRATRFSRKEIQFVYRAFKQECPTGMVNEETFKAIYAKFFPQGDSSQYAHYVFNTLDRNKTGTITFSDIMLSLSILLKGSLQERIRWAFSLYHTIIDSVLDIVRGIVHEDGPMIHSAILGTITRSQFNLYDVNDDGYVTREELSEVITAIYDLIGDHQCHHHRGSNALEGEASVPETPNDHVDRMFKKLDLNHDGVITVDEFIDYCSTNDNIRSSFAVFDDLW